MNHEKNGDAVRLLEAYLDGQLSGPERAAFERRLQGDRKLRAAVQSQKQIDGSLQRLFAPPAGDDVLRRLPSGSGSTGRAAEAAPPARRWTRPALASAAAIGLAILGGWMVRSALRPPPPLVAEYRQRAAAGWNADWECPPRPFAVMLHRRFGQGAILAGAPAGVKPLGVCYCNVISKRTIYLIATAGDVRVAVFIDRLDNDPGQPAPDDDELRQFRRELGPLVLYELTPLDQPRLIDGFELQDVPPDWLNTLGYGPGESLSDDG